MRNKILSKVTLLFISILVAASGLQISKVFAEDSTSFRNKRIDADGDGLISRSEANDIRRRIFANIDFDGNGVITPNEITARQDQISMSAELRQTRLALAASRMDTDGDGAITPDEMENGPDLFRLLDRNDDDSISPQEMSIFQEVIGLKLN